MTARRLGRRGEALLLPLAALLLLLATSAFTLFSYRSGVERWAEEELRRAARLAGEAAAELAGEPPGGAAAAAAAAVPGAERLRRLSPRAVRLLLLDGAGRPLVVAGEPLPPPSPAWPSGLPPPGALTGPTAAGPGGELPDGTIAGLAPLGPPDSRRVLRVDLPAGALAAQLAGLRVLTPLVLGLDAAVLILLLLFLRHLWSPFDRLVERARRLDPSPGGDEVELLVRTFERAVETLAAGRGDGPEAEEADIAALSRTLAGSLESGVLLLDDSGAVLALNPIGADLLALEPPAPGTAAAAALGRHPALVRCLEEALAGGRGVNRRELEIAAPGADGATRTLGLTVHPLRRDDGEVRGYLVLFADLTESRRRAREAHLAESLSRLGELAAGVAHELRNGLATLRGYLTLIERARGEERAADYLAEIRREADHLERVLSDFLAFARPGTARVETVPVASLARRAAADPALGEVGVVPEVAADATAAVVLGDPQLLERALRNLLLNAARAERDAGRSGPLELTVRRAAPGAGAGVEGDAVEIAVADRGPGVPEEVRERLFHPFATGRPEGVGLGLALTHRIASLHGGSVRLEDREGGGTRAVLALPAGKSVTEGNGDRVGAPTGSAGESAPSG